LYLFVVLSAIGVATNLKADEFMDLVAKMGMLTAVASLALLIVYRRAALGAIGDDFPDFRGIFSQKNVLGQAMTIGALGCLHGIRAGRRGRLRNVLSLMLVTIVALMSKSATSCMAIFAFCGVDAVAFLMRKGGAARILAAIISVLAVPVLVVTIVAPGAFLEMIGKDPTLTGRTDIWGFVILDIFQKPWLGWGYLAFWSLDNPASLEIADALGWVVPQAHNGVLEILLNVGFIGGTFTFYIFARVFWMSLRCLKGPEKNLAMSCLLLCIGIILVGASETVLIDPFEASTGIFFIAGLFCEKALRTANLRPRRYSARPLSVSLQGGMAKVHPSFLADVHSRLRYNE
jgi:exopolysaccharide production protein ExoQ